MINSFSPVSGPIGTEVTITGANFSSIPGNNIVYFGGAKAIPISSSATSIVVKVPHGATFAPITVTTSNLTAYSRMQFVVTFPSAALNFTSSSFTRVADFAIAGRGYMGIAAGDLDLDGKIDLTCSNVGIRAARNISTREVINFQPTDVFSIGNYAYANTLADFDGDGMLDIAVAKASGSSFDLIYEDMSVLRNISTTGTINYDTRIDLRAVNGDWAWYWITSGDIDNDGRPDIVITNNSGGGSGKIAIFRNRSTPGNIQFDPVLLYTTRDDPRGVTLADIDNDGLKDILVANQAADGFSIFKNLSNSGNVSMAPRLDYLSGTSNLCETVAVADLNLDDKLDIIVANNNTPGTISIFKNNSTPGSISLSPMIEYATTDYPFGIACNDFNGDGKPDLAITDNVSNSITLFKNTSSGGSISLSKQVTYTGFLWPRDITSADLNQDGKPEIIVKNWQDFTISILQNEMELTTLPLHLLEFKAEENDGKSNLHWKTENEENTLKFIVEHSSDGITYSSIGVVAAKEFTTTQEEYQFIHSNPTVGENYYRLKMVDRDGKYTYSKVVSLGFQRSVNLEIWPNPVTTTATVVHPTGNLAWLRVYDINGLLIREVMCLASGKTVINFTGLAKGIYNISWSDNTTIINGRVLKK